MEHNMKNYYIKKNGNSQQVVERNGSGLLW